MAIWQYRCFIVPKSKTVDNADYEDILSWAKMDLGMEKIQHINQILKPEKSWSDSILQYGRLDETCIEFFKENNCIEEISLRLDLRTLQKSNLQQILAYIEQLEGALFDGHKIFPATIEACLNAIRQSDAKRYCQNPIAFLQGLS